MKHLYLFRHGKAEISLKATNDFSRDLIKKGIAKTKIISKKLKYKGINFDLFISSPANRAIQTAEITANFFGYNKNYILKRKILYNFFSTDPLFSVIKNVNNNVNSLIIFGHNPTFELAVNKLCGTAGIQLKKSSATCIELNINDWRMINQGSGRLIFTDNP